MVNEPGYGKLFIKTVKTEIITEFVNDTIYSLSFFDTKGRKVFEVNAKNGLSPSTSSKLFNIAAHVRYFKFENMSYNPFSRRPENNLEEPDLACVDLISRIFVMEGENASIDYWNFFELLEEINIIEANSREQTRYKYNGEEVVFTTIQSNGFLVFTKQKNYETKLITEVYYFLNGNISEERTFSYFNPKIKHGRWKVFYENGDKKVVVNYKDDKLHGTLKIWNQKGELIKHEKYKNGELTDKKI